MRVSLAGCKTQQERAARVRTFLEQAMSESERRSLTQAVVDGLDEEQIEDLLAVLREGNAAAIEQGVHWFNDVSADAAVAVEAAGPGNYRVH